MNKNLIIVGLFAVVVVLVAAFLVSNGILNLSASSKYKSSDEVSDATVGIGTGIENIGSTLEEIDRSLS